MLSAVIVAYRTPADLASAVASLKAQTHPPDEIIVVDNGAADGTPIPDSAALVGVRLERPAENLGFGAGCNLGARLASGHELLLMNSDVVLQGDAAEEMLAALHGDERIAVVGPRVFSNGRLQESARAFPSLRTGLLGRRSAITRLLLRTQRYPAELRPAYGAGGPVDWVSGACILVRRTAFEAVCGFDEGYWMYWEDADLCRRLAYDHWMVHFEPRAVVHHTTGASGTSRRTVSAFHASAARFSDLHIAKGRLQGLIVTGVLRLRARSVLWAMGRARRTS